MTNQHARVVQFLRETLGDSQIWKACSENKAREFQTRIRELLSRADRTSVSELLARCTALDEALKAHHRERLAQLQREREPYRRIQEVCGPVWKAHPEWSVEQCVEYLRATGQLQTNGKPSADAIRVIDAGGRA
jgi:hypothetical protein